MRFRNSIYLSLALTAAAVLLLAWAPARASQSSQDQSVAEAAKRNRDKKKDATKPTKVITDDDLDRSNFIPGQSGVNVGGPPEAETQPPSPAAVAAAETADKATEESLKKAATEEDAQITKLKLKIADAEKDLDLARREFALDREAYYSKTDFVLDKAGKAKLDDEQQQIAAKQQELDGLKARLAALVESQSRRKAPPKAASSEPAEKPATPAPPQT